MKEFEAKIKKCLKDIEDLEKQRPNSVFVKMLRDRLFAAKAISENHKRVAEVDFQLKLIGVEIEKIKKGSPQEQQEMEKAAKAALFEPERQKAAYEGEKKAFQSGLMEDAFDVYASTK